MQPLSATPRSTGGKQASGQGAAGPASERWPYPTPLLTALHRRISDSPSAMNPWPPLGLRAPSPIGSAVRFSARLATAYAPPSRAPVPLACTWRTRSAGPAQVEENLEKGAKSEPKGVGFTVYDRSDWTPVGTAGLFKIAYADGTAEFGDRDR